MILEKISDKEAALIDLYPDVTQVEPDQHGIVSSTQIMSPVRRADEGKLLFTENSMQIG